MQLKYYNRHAPTYVLEVNVDGNIGSAGLHQKTTREYYGYSGCWRVITCNAIWRGQKCNRAFRLVSTDNEIKLTKIGKITADHTVQL